MSEPASQAQLTEEPSALPHQTNPLPAQAAPTKPRAPKDADLGSLTAPELYERGRKHVDSGDCLLGVPAFWQVIDRFASDPRAEYSANLLLDCLVRGGDFEVIVEALTRLENNTLLLANRESLQELLKAMRYSSDRRRAEIAERSETSRSAVGFYVSLATEDAKAADELLYNAGVCFELAGLLGHAVHSFRELMIRVPHSPHRERALIRTAQLHARVARFRASAAAWERLAKEYSGAKQAPGGLHDAIRYRLALGDLRTALKNVETFMRNYGRKEPRLAPRSWWSSFPSFEGRAPRHWLATCGDIPTRG